MQLQQLSYFVEIAERGSFNKAAEALFVTQPKLSKAISNLEAELNTEIFLRTNKGVALTEEGKKLYQYARTILNQIELINNMAPKEPPRLLSIASYPILTMGRLVSQFYLDHRAENISLKMLECRIQRVIDRVENSEAEIGFIMINNVQVKEIRHTLNYKNLKYNPLGTDTWYVNVGPNHPLYGRDEVAITEMLDYPFVRLPDDYFSNLTFYLEIDGIPLNRFTRVVYVSDSAAILSLLQSTDVFRFGPGLSAPDFARYGIRTIPIRNCRVQIDVGWIQRKRELLSREAQDFVGMLEKLYPV